MQISAQCKDGFMVSYILFFQAGSYLLLHPTCAFVYVCQARHQPQMDQNRELKTVGR